MRSYSFVVLSCQVILQCDDADLLAKLAAVWPSTPEHPELSPLGLSYRIDASEDEDRYSLWRDGAGLAHRVDLGGLLYALDKDILIFLQQQHAQLLFVHGAVLQQGENCILITGSSGAGKSSLALALTQHAASHPQSWRLLSDELAPIQLDAGRVYPYYRALGLKTPLAEGLQLPTGSMRLRDGLQIPPASLARPELVPTRLAAVYSLRGQFASHYARGSRMATADAALIYLRNTLNNLAHDGAGLPAAIKLAARVPCFNLPRLALSDACALIDSHWHRLQAARES